MYLVFLDLSIFRFWDYVPCTVTLCFFSSNTIGTFGFNQR